MALRENYDCVAVEIDEDGIAWVTFNRPEKRNAMNPQLHFEMEEILTHLETDPAAKVIVLTGAGNAWSAGMDLKVFPRDRQQPGCVLPGLQCEQALELGHPVEFAQADDCHGQRLPVRRCVRRPFQLRSGRDR
jgi:enoyl-CoA hydratase/carnithine racemase